MRAIVRYRWKILLGVLGAFEVWLAATAVGPARILGILGGLLVLAAAVLRPRPWTLALVVGGVAPFAVLTWWSVTTPLVAVLAVGFAAVAARSAGRPA
jgi:hypothetical protein